MCRVYVLKSKKDNKFYIGSTKDIEKRISCHNAGKVRSTKSRRPFVLLHQEEYENTKMARQRENFLKSGQGRKWLKELLKDKTEEWLSGLKRRS